MGDVLAGPGFRTCSHPACRWPAVATLRFEYGTRRVWLDDLPPEAHPASYDLCSVHADRFSPPRGWEAEDRRRGPGEQPAAPPASPPRRRARHARGMAVREASAPDS